MKKLFLSALFALALVFIGADSEAKGPYISLYGGGILPFDSELEFDGMQGIDFDQEFDTGWGGGVSTGYWFVDQGLPFVGLALDFSGHTTETSWLKYEDIKIFEVDSNLHVGTGMLNLIFRLPIGPVRPYVGAGAGWLWAQLEDGDLVLGSVRTPFNGDDTDAFAWQAIGGIDVKVTPISPKLSFFAEYRYLRSDFSIGGGSAMGLEADLDYETSEVFGGFTWHFQE